MKKYALLFIILASCSKQAEVDSPALTQVSPAQFEPVKTVPPAQRKPTRKKMSSADLEQHLKSTQDERNVREKAFYREFPPMRLKTDSDPTTFQSGLSRIHELQDARDLRTGVTSPFRYTTLRHAFASYDVIQWKPLHRVRYVDRDKALQHALRYRLTHSMDVEPFDITVREIR